MILVLRALGVGDLATAVPALRGLRRAFPDQPLALAAPRWLAPLVELTGCVDELVPVAGLAPVDWPVAWPYWAVNLHGRGPESHRLLRVAEPVLLRAFACPAADHDDGPAWRPDEHEVRRWCRLLDWYGVETDPDDLDLRRPDPSRLPVGATVLHPGGKDPARRWSPARFAAVARELDRRGHRVVVTGSADERELARWVAERAGLPGTAVLAGAFDLAGLAALVAHGRLVVSADTGVAHLATAYRTPSVVLFGPVRPEHWGPPPDRPWHRVLGGAPTAADDSGDADGARGRVLGGTAAGDQRQHPALAAVGPLDVIEAADAAEIARV
ncbi:glycosyltransferase family 9 protein [Plantactinospora sp. GCM10030261]|uniref:glycosyltransferase family 9 protein n=1 Tax=Plantactinospora sp. GCM10030261 TaxID=3273420 RepID=UPI003608861D